MYPSPRTLAIVSIPTSASTTPWRTSWTNSTNSRFSTKFRGVSVGSPVPSSIEGRTASGERTPIVVGEKARDGAGVGRKDRANVLGVGRGW